MNPSRGNGNTVTNVKHMARGIRNNLLLNPVLPRFGPGPSFFFLVFLFFMMIPSRPPAILRLHLSQNPDTGRSHRNQRSHHIIKWPRSFEAFNRERAMHLSVPRFDFEVVVRAVWPGAGGYLFSFDFFFLCLDHPGPLGVFDSWRDGFK